MSGPYCFEQSEFERKRLITPFLSPIGQIRLRQRVFQPHLHPKIMFLEFFFSEFKLGKIPCPDLIVLNSLNLRDKGS